MRGPKGGGNLLKRLYLTKSKVPRPSRCPRGFYIVPLGRTLSVWRYPPPCGNHTSVAGDHHFRATELVAEAHFHDLGGQARGDRAARIGSGTGDDGLGGRAG